MPVRAPSTQVIVILVVGMLVCGASNSIWSKWQDMQCVLNCENPDETTHGNFERLIAFFLISSPLNPWRPATRASASAAARKAVLASQQSRLASAPLSRPDESAFDFGESAISLRNEDVYDSEETGGGGMQAKGAAQHKEEDGMNWKDATLFWAPAVFDIMGTTCSNVGLLFVPVSVYQMVRGALVLWVGLLSLIFLDRKLAKFQWLALATVMLGVAVVGVSSLGGKKEATGADEAAGSPIVGILLILVSQIFTASQFVIEEKVMEKNSVDPMLAVGYEGFFGLATTLAAVPFLHHFFGRLPSGEGNLGYFDAPNGLREIFDNPPVWGSSIVIAFSIALFNFCGLAVTKSVSATARSTIDTCRTLIIWIVSLYLGWEKFKWLQVVGFGLLVYGTFVFNGISRFPDWTGFHAHEYVPTPAITISDEEDDDLPEEDEHLACKLTQDLSMSGNYTASEPLALVGSGLYFVPSLALTYLTVLKRSHYMWPFVVGVWLETIGYDTRYLNSRFPSEGDSTSGYQVVTVLFLVIAPAFMAATHYMVFKRIAIQTAGVAEVMIIRLKWITAIFVGFDCLVAGVALFLALCLFSGSVILFRCIYRFLGICITHGTTSDGQKTYPLEDHEWAFYVFDTLPILGITYLFLWVQPSRYIQRMARGTDVEMSQSSGQDLLKATDNRSFGRRARESLWK
ncbi:hypothetical protein RQP46_000752 [Phenoliferia psychrophenolica]